MGDNELYSKMPLANCWHICRGLIRSVLRLKSCSSLVIMSNIVKLTHCKRMPTFSYTFLKWSYLVVFKNNSLCKMGDNDLYSIKSLIANFWHFCSVLIWSYLRSSACAWWEIMNYIVEMSPIENESHHFCRRLVWSFYENSLCKIRDNELYSSMFPYN